jgi:hypothetical protein
VVHHRFLPFRVIILITRWQDELLAFCIAMHPKSALVILCHDLFVVSSSAREHSLAMQSALENIKREFVVIIVPRMNTICVVALTGHIRLSPCESSTGAALSGFVEEGDEQMPHRWNAGSDDNHELFGPHRGCQPWIAWFSGDDSGVDSHHPNDQIYSIV